MADRSCFGARRQELTNFHLRFLTFHDTGSHGASRHVEILAFPTGDKALFYLKNSCGCSSVLGLLGAVPNGYEKKPLVQTEDNQGGILSAGMTENELQQQQEHPSRKFSLPIHLYSPSNITGSLCLVVAKGRQGLPASLARLCDAFVHVPHHDLAVGDEKPCCTTNPLLDTPSCMSIALHEITRRMVGWNERQFHGQKYELAQQANTQASSVVSVMKRRQRQQYMEEHQREAEEHEEMGKTTDFFGSLESEGGQGDY